MFNKNVRKKGAKMIIGNEWKPLLDEYESACDEEAITIKALNKAVHVRPEYALNRLLKRRYSVIKKLWII
jgi:ppGpp synthetase/RelA/SpoT-type nucleotidyltranferase